VKTHRADQLPDANSIDRLAASESPRERGPKDIKVAVNTGKGWELQDVSSADVPQRFKIGAEGLLADDVRRMVEWLQLNPISPASERLTRDAGTRIIHNGAPVKLWRFAPNRAPQLNVDANNRYWRVVYGLAKDGLIVTDILDHNAFDKKYK
jgi:hypothetical protein